MKKLNSLLPSRAIAAAALSAILATAPSFGASVVFDARNNSKVYLPDEHGAFTSQLAGAETSYFVCLVDEEDYLRYAGCDHLIYQDWRDNKFSSAEYKISGTMSNGAIPFGENTGVAMIANQLLYDNNGHLWNDRRGNVPEEGVRVCALFVMTYASGGREYYIARAVSEVLEDIFDPIRLSLPLYSGDSELACTSFDVSGNSVSATYGLLIGWHYGEFPEFLNSLVVGGRVVVHSATNLADAGSKFSFPVDVAVTNSAAGTFSFTFDSDSPRLFILGLEAPAP
jgi:hypothetical protein